MVAKGIIDLLSARLRYTNAYATKLAFLDVSGRVAARLLELADRYGVPTDGIEIDLRLTQAEWASSVAASRESVNKVLCAFRVEGYIRIEDQVITILDRRALERQVYY
jgi:CRP/FNR family transcriptional regulator